MDLITLALSKSYTNKVKQELIDAGWKKTIVEQLPLVGDDKTIYLLQKEDAQGNVYYDEYLWTNGSYNAFGTTQTDMTNYYKKTETDSLLNGKVDKVSGKGLSTNDFTNEYKSKIETNEYNDVFNIRVEWNREYMPNAELIKINFQEYENGRLTNRTVTSGDVKDITNGNVYLYKDSSDWWWIKVGTEPSSGSYSRLPMLIGHIATKTVNGTTVKLFFRNDDDEAQFDKLNSEKIDSDLLVPLTQSAYDNLPYINPDAYYFIEKE